MWSAASRSLRKLGAFGAYLAGRCWNGSKFKRGSRIGMSTVSYISTYFVNHRALEMISIVH
jgi:hypothetical protein